MQAHDPAAEYEAYKLQQKGLAPTNEVVVNEAGGKNSPIPYAFHLVPPEALFALANVFGEGAKKYERDNWHNIPAEDCINHALGHLVGYLAGDRSDDHLGHAICRIAMAIRQDQHGLLTMEDILGGEA
ncbi:MAG: hypothetical protein KKE29_20025 [Proteobacteria bacterium]|nr:hypothetical protein [Pseudomonadota bacterium]MBU4576011.1 hypothetical protein [Pseudomonadota bacterium]MBV1715977.1 hypothetical protein [Desulfarculus sp.]